jgi:hypothetical protein
MPNAERRRPPQAASRLTHHVPPGTPSRIPLPATRHSPLATRRLERGVALVITLLLLSVITFMAITFLVVSHTERGSVATQTDLTIARLAADTARDRAAAEIAVPILAATNEFNYGLLVSANYIPPDLNNALYNLTNLFYNPRPPVFIVTNTLGSNDFRFYVDLNRNGKFDPTGLQTNLGFETGDPQWIGILQHPELPHSADNLFSSRYAYLVVPVGQTLDINTIHNDAKRVDISDPNKGDGFLRNQGVLTSEINLAAFLKDLNPNYWADYTYKPYDGSGNPSQSPNDGVAFYDATSLLRYRYGGNWNNLGSISTLLPAGANPFRGDFIDGYSAGPVMLGTWWQSSGPPDHDDKFVSSSWPGADNPKRFYTTQDLFDTSKTRSPLLAPLVQAFTDRLWMAGTSTNSFDRTTFYRLLSQLGTDSASEPQDKMNLNYCNVDDNGYVAPNMATNFTAWQPTQFFTNVAIRLLADAGYTVGALGSSANLLVLTTNYNGVAVTNLQIPIWPTNFYTPSVHRLLQLAANIYDATTNRTDLGVKDYPFLPSVFRPLFSEGNPNQAGQRRVFVVGYEALDPKELATPNNPFLSVPRPHDLSDDDDLLRLGKVQTRSMVYNVPLVIGVKKGLPSFDEFTMDTKIQVARKLIFHRANYSADTKVNEMDPVYLLTITNEVGLQAWNSYAANFNRRLQIQVWPDVSILVSNRVTGKLLNNTAALWNRLPNAPTNYPTVTVWPGYNPPFNVQDSFITPLGAPTTNYVFMPTNCVYSFSADQFTVNGIPDRTSGYTNYTVPQLQVTVKARLRFAIVDISTPSTPQIVDYVNLAANKEIDLTDALQRNSDGNYGFNQIYSPTYSAGGLWSTNWDKARKDLLTFGVRLQFDISRGTFQVSPNVWANSLTDPVYAQDKDKGVARFKAQFYGNDPNYPKINTFAAPFQPLRNIHMVTVWQANDPLVHYTVGDLKNTTDLTNAYFLDQLSQSDKLPPTPYGALNSRCQPWGGNAAKTTPTDSDWRVKDAVAKIKGTSDDWDFPTNKLPHVGWLGRVHRGTPWQTVYLKAPGIDFPTWWKWSGNDLVVTNYGQFRPNMPQLTNVVVVGGTNLMWAWDSAFTQPVNDWRLLDIFSTSFDPSATRGRLSINQTNLAAWSAVLSGVMVLTNSGFDAALNGVFDPAEIKPAGIYSNTAGFLPAVAQIVNGINNTRANTDTAFPVFHNRVFRRLGDILAVPELTATYPQQYVGSYPNGYWAQVSPFLDFGDPKSKDTSGLTAQQRRGLSDAALERIPQQILGLLKCDQTPRVVVYAFGQTLKPAPRSRVTSGAFFGLCTNYQITAEVATRALIRFDGVPAYQQGVPPPINNLHPVIESFNVLPPD